MTGEQIAAAFRGPEKTEPPLTKAPEEPTGPLGSTETWKGIERRTQEEKLKRQRVDTAMEAARVAATVYREMVKEGKLKESEPARAAVSEALRPVEDVLSESRLAQVMRDLTDQIDAERSAKIKDLEQPKVKAEGEAALVSQLGQTGEPFEAPRTMTAAELTSLVQGGYLSLDPKTKRLVRTEKAPPGAPTPGPVAPPAEVLRPGEPPPSPQVVPSGPAISGGAQDLIRKTGEALVQVWMAEAANGKGHPTAQYATSKYESLFRKTMRYGKMGQASKATEAALHTHLENLQKVRAQIFEGTKQKGTPVPKRPPESKVKVKGPKGTVELTHENVDDTRTLTEWVMDNGGFWDDAGKKGEKAIVAQNHPTFVGGRKLIRKGGMGREKMIERLYEDLYGANVSSETTHVDTQALYDAAAERVDRWIQGDREAASRPRGGGPMSQAQAKEETISRVVEQVQEHAGKMNLKVSPERVRKAMEGEGVSEFSPEDLKPGEVVIDADKGDIFRVEKNPNPEPPLPESDILLRDGEPFVPNLDQKIRGVKLKAKRAQPEEAAAPAEPPPTPEPVVPPAEVRTPTEQPAPAEAPRPEEPPALRQMDARAQSKSEAPYFDQLAQGWEFIRNDEGHLRLFGDRDMASGVAYQLGQKDKAGDYQIISVRTPMGSEKFTVARAEGRFEIVDKRTGQAQSGPLTWDQTQEVLDKTQKQGDTNSWYRRVKQSPEAATMESVQRTTPEPTFTGEEGGGQGGLFGHPEKGGKAVEGYPQPPQPGVTRAEERPEHLRTAGSEGVERTPAPAAGEGPIAAAARKVKRSFAESIERFRQQHGLDKPETIVRRSNMVKDLESVVRTPVRSGLAGHRGMLGFFRPFERIVRLKNMNDIPVLAHEGGHAIKSLMFPEITARGFKYEGWEKKTILKELVGLGKALYGTTQPAGGYANEGFAEFIRYWMFDRAKAESAAPKFAEEWKRRLMLDDSTVQLGAVLEKVGRDWNKWKEMPSVYKVLSHLSIGESPLRPLTLGRIYSALFDREHALDLATRGIWGGKSPEHMIGNPYTLGILYRGAMGLAELMVERGGGVPDMKTNEFLGFIRRHQLDDPKLISGTQPILPVPYRGQPFSEKVLSAKLARFEQMGLVEPVAGPGGRNWYRMNDTGRAYLKRHTFEKKAPSLADILLKHNVLDEPLPIVNAISERFKTKTDKILSKLPAKWFDVTGTRGLDSFRVYMVAKRTIEAAERSKVLAGRAARAGRKFEPIETGIDLADAKAAVAELEKPNFKAAFEDIQKWRNAQLDILVDSGVMDRNLAETLKKTWKWYVPFYRFMEENPLQRKSGSPRGYANVKGPIKRMKGSQLQIIDPIESLVADAYVFAQRAKQNQVMRAIYDATEEFPGAGWAVEEMPERLRPVTIRRWEMEKLVREWLDESEFGKQTAQLFEDAGQKAPEIDVDKLFTIFRPADFVKGGENIATFMDQGKPRFLKMDPELYRAVSGMDYETANWFLKVIGAPARFTRAGATLTLEFFMRNLVRDAVSAAVLSETGGVNPLSGFRPGIETVRGFRSGLAKDDWWFKWKAAGGSHSSMVSLDRNYFKKNLRELYQPETMRAMVKNVALHPIEAMRGLSEVGEMGTRLGVFRRAIEEYGMDQDAILKAAVKSREGTIDFNRSGYLMEIPRRTIPFFNAGIQGIDRFGRVLTNIATGKKVGLKGGRAANATRFATRITTYAIAPSLITWAVWQLQSDEKKKEYEDASPWERDLFWKLPLPGEGNSLHIPKAFEMVVSFGSGTERALDEMFANAPESAKKDYAQSVVASLTPNMVASFMLPVVENFANWQLYSGRPIEPEAERRMEPFMRYGSTTSETAKIGAAGLREVPGLEGMSPRQVDNLIRAWGAGLATYYAMPLLDRVVAATAGKTEAGQKLGIGKRVFPKPRWQEFPVVRGFVSRPEHMRTNILDRVYGDIEASEKAYNTYRQLDAAQGEKYLSDPEKRRLIVGFHHFADAKKALSALGSARRDAIKDRDFERQKAIQKASIDVAEKAAERAKDAFADTTAQQAVRIDKVLFDLRHERAADRTVLATTIEEAIDNDRLPELRAATWPTLSAPDRLWANRYAMQYRIQKRKTEEQLRMKQVPKKEKVKVRQLTKQYSEAAP